MSLISMLTSGPTINQKPKKPHVYPPAVIAEWKEAYRCIGIGERTTAEVAVKMNRVRSPRGLPSVCESALHRRLRKMETLGYVSHRKIVVDYSTKPVMVWKRVTPPCP